MYNIIGYYLFCIIRLSKKGKDKFIKALLYWGDVRHLRGVDGGMTVMEKFIETRGQRNPLYTFSKELTSFYNYD